MLELMAGVIVALAALALVLEPLLAKEASLSLPASVEPDFTSIEESESPKIRALLALKEIEFDRATGKLSDEDYAGLKAKYSAEAVEEIKKEEVAAAEAVDAAEHAVQLAKRAALVVCPACGPRPEPAAVFCSECGRLLSRVVG